MRLINTVVLWSVGGLSVVSSQPTSCPACDSLKSRWNPVPNTGSCLGNVNDTTNYIVGFEQCICSPGTLSDYTACANCNLTGDGGVPIDGLNFGPPAQFSSNCSRFSADVTSVLQPSGLNAFASVVRGALTSTDRASVDLLGFYIFQNVVTEMATQTALITDSVSYPATRFTLPTNATATTRATRSAGLNVSDAGRSANSMPITGILSLIMIAILTAVIIV